MNAPYNPSELLRNRPPRQPCWIEPAVLPHSSKFLISAPRKVGKSWTVLEFARALASGSPLFGEFAVPAACRVLYLDNELGQQTVLDRWERYDPLSDLAAGGNMQAWSFPAFSFDDDAGLAMLDRHLKNLWTNVLIIDPINQFTAASVTDPGASQAFTQRLNTVLRKRSDQSLSIICVLHDNKEPTGRDSAHYDALDWRNSSSAGIWGAWADSMLKLAPADGGTPGVELFQHGRWTLRHGAQPPDFKLRVAFSGSPVVSVVDPGEHRFALA